MRVTGSAISPAITISKIPVKMFHQARIAPPDEVGFRPGRADRVEDACAEERGNKKPDQNTMDHLNALQ